MGVIPTIGLLVAAIQNSQAPRWCSMPAKRGYIDRGTRRAVRNALLANGKRRCLRGERVDVVDPTLTSRDLLSLDRSTMYGTLIRTYTPQMELPDLPPDFSFPRLDTSKGAIDFAFAAKKDAMGPHIAAKWGWDETFQRLVHERRFAERPFYQIVRKGNPVGVLSLMQLSDHLRFGEFYLLSTFHRQGIGTAVLRHCLQLCDDLGMPVRLEYLHWNPVGSLYRRHGFVVIGQSEIHCFMERSAGTFISSTA